jgi:dynein heavy chain, axonemal
VHAAAVLSSDLQRLEWAAQGLPADEHSLASALIATQGLRTPLLLDSEGQLVRWLRKSLEHAGLMVVRSGDSRLAHAIEGAAQLGQPVLLVLDAGGSCLPGCLEGLLDAGQGE